MVIEFRFVANPMEYTINGGANWYPVTGNTTAVLGTGVTGGLSSFLNGVLGQPYSDNSTTHKVIIGTGVTGIAANAFQNCY